LPGSRRPRSNAKLMMFPASLIGMGRTQIPPLEPGWDDTPPYPRLRLTAHALVQLQLLDENKQVKVASVKCDMGMNGILLAYLTSATHRANLTCQFSLHHVFRCGGFSTRIEINPALPLLGRQGPLCPVPCLLKVALGNFLVGHIETPDGVRSGTDHTTPLLVPGGASKTRCSRFPWAAKPSGRTSTYAARTSRCWRWRRRGTCCFRYEGRPGDSPTAPRGRGRAGVHAA
jgi:hypothetical protein